MLDVSYVYMDVYLPTQEVGKIRIGSDARIVLDAYYLFFTTAMGILLGTIARSMPQLGLLYIMIALPLNLLSGANRPLEGMPPLLRVAMEASPTNQFVSFAQAILYRGAGLDVVWPEFLAVTVIGMIFFALALLRFRRITAQMM